MEDLAAARAFYAQALGMRVVRDDPDYIDLVLGDVRLALEPFHGLRHGHYLAHPGTRVGERVEFCLEVPDLEAARRRIIAAGVPMYEPEQLRPWGRRDFRVIGPEGVYWNITSVQLFAVGPKIDQTRGEPHDDHRPSPQSSRPARNAALSRAHDK